MDEKTTKEQTYEAKSLLLAPNYVKDVQVRFGSKQHYKMDGPPYKMLTISIEINPDEADKLRNTPGMDDQQFVAFLMPCIETSIYKTIQQGMGNRQQKNQVEIEEAAEAPMMQKYESMYDQDDVLRA